MTVQRLPVPATVAIVYTDSLGQQAFMLPIRRPDGTWETLCDDGLSSFDSAESCRQFVAEWQRDLDAGGEAVTDADRECWAAYEALAEVFEQLQGAAS